MSEGVKDEVGRRIRLVHLTPIAVILSFAWPLSMLLILLKVALPQPAITPIPELPRETGPGAALSTISPYVNSLIFILITAASGTAIIFAIRRFGSKTRYFILAFIWFATSALSSFYTLLAAVLLAIITNDIAIFNHALTYQYVIGVGLASIIVLVLLRAGELASLVASTYVGAGVGVMLGASLPFWTTIVLLVAISCFDVLAVRRGHLKRIGDINPTDLKGLMVEFRGMGLGLGDVFFYSLLIHFSLANFGLISGIAASIGVFAGFSLTLQLLKKNSLVPALPQPLLIGMALVLVTNVF